MNIADKTLQLKKDFDDVYKAGQSSMVDESKIIEKTVSGEYISVDDVSEIPHKVKVMLTSGGKNLWSKGDATLIQASTYDIKLYAGITYTMSAVVTSDDTDNTLCLIYDLTNDKELGCLERNIRSSITFTPTADIYKLYMYAGRNYPTSAGDTATFSDIMIEENDTATEYEPYKETLTDYSGVSFNTYGKNLLNQAEMKTGTQSGVTLEYLEDEDCFLVNGTAESTTNRFVTYIFKEGVQNANYTISTTYISGTIEAEGLNALVYLAESEINTGGSENWLNTRLGNNNNSNTKKLNKKYISAFWLYLNVGVKFNNYKFRIQLEHGSQSTPYEKFNGQTLTANSDGTVEGVKSTSPYMYMTTDNQNVTINATYHKSYGMQTEYDRFWDNAQRKGTLNNYRGFFVGPAWTPKTLTPKYLIKPLDTTNITQFGNMMFQYCNFGNSNLIDFRTIADKFDFSEMKMANNMFDSAYMDNIYCNFKNARNLQYTFSANWASKITTITLYVSSTCTEYNNTFTYLSTLQNLTFEKGSEIVGSINLQWSTKLTKASILSIFNALSATKSGLTLTLSKTAVTNAFGSTTATEWTNLVATKTNWTISLV